MAGMPKVTEIRSISRYGLSVVTVVFADDTNIYFARQMVGERMREAEAAVPARYGKSPRWVQSAPDLARFISSWFAAKDTR